MDGEDPLREEKSRLCPSCRMQISALAVKCRYCGEEVGKPKLEQRTLSINDLGGESIYHRAPAGSVTEALEAFRVEAGLGIDGVGQPPDASEGAGVSAPDIGPDGMPVLDDDPLGERSGSGWYSAITSVHKARPPTFRERLKTVGIIVGGIVLLVLLGVKAPGWIEDYRLSRAGAVVPTFVDDTERMLREGYPPIDALAEAVRAVAYEDSASHRSSRKNALEKLIEQVEGLLYAKPFDSENLRKAQGLITRARNLYLCHATIELAKTVQNDTKIYGMILIKIDQANFVATFQANNSELMEAEKGGVLAGRFRVHSVTKQSVTLIDQERGNRVVRCKVGDGPISLPG